MLCLRAAVTVVRFLQEQLRLHGHEYLDGLLDGISAEGMDDVNRLYQTILNITYTSNTRSNQNDGFTKSGHDTSDSQYAAGCFIFLRVE